MTALALTMVAATAQPAAAERRRLGAPSRLKPALSDLPMATGSLKASSPVGGVFGPSSVWRQDVSSAPVAADSAQQVAGLAQQVADRYGGVAAFNVVQYNTTFHVADPGTPRQDVAFEDCQKKGYVPRDLYDPRYGAHFASVPIPTDAVPANGTDAELTVWDPVTDQLWEFWKARRTPTGWSACWGGRIDGVSTSRGFFSGYMGATATGLPNAGGMLGIQEAQLGRIEHALSLQLVDLDHWDVVSYPAQRSDGWNPQRLPHRIAEGTRLRMDPNMNIDNLHLHPLAKMIAKAAQTYGFIVTDKSGAVAVVAESGAPTKARTGTDPWTALLAGTPSYDVMKNFPWHKLQALPSNYGR